jgi:hypothetical protein
MDRRQISPLRLGTFAAAPAEPCKCAKTSVEMTRAFRILLVKFPIGIKSNHFAATFRKR